MDRQPLIPWLRTNLSLVVFFSSLLSGTVGMLVTTGSVVNNLQHLMTERGATLKQHTEDLEKFHQNMVDVDHRLNDEKAFVAELRRNRDVQIGLLEERIAVLEAQIRFLADRSPTPQPLDRHR